MKIISHFLSSLILLTIILFINCTEDPAGPDISDDLKPKGNIIGWVYDMWDRPLKDVLVSDKQKMRCLEQIESLKGIT